LPPFQSLSSICTNEALKIIGKFDPESAIVYRSFKQPEKYLSERREVEEWIRNGLLKKVGNLKIFSLIISF
jgi:hypothetical protein